MGYSIAPSGLVDVEDGSALTRQAWDLLEKEGKDVDLPDLHIESIADFLKSTEEHRTPTTDRETILEQATLMFDHLYPHMPFKAEIYQFAHPSDYLNQNVRPHLDALSEIDFQEQMITAFSLVRDAHTLYGLPSPFRGAVAFLPFQIRPYQEQGPAREQNQNWRFVVTSVMNTNPNGGFDHPYFGPGVEIVKWGTLSVADHVKRTKAHLPGGNYFASLMRGSIHSTLRPLVFVQLPFPDETPAVTIEYKPLGSDQTRAIRIPWAVGTGFGGTPGFPNSVFSVSPATAITTACGKILHHRADIRDDRKMVESQDPNQVSTLPGIFDFQYTGAPRKKSYIDLDDLVDPSRPDARFGYIRILSFSGGSTAPGFTDRIVDEFQRIVTLMDRVAPDGLVIDIRSNPGGDVQAAERMLQMLVAAPIEPARFHLANTPTVLGLLRSLKTATSEQLAVADDVKLSQALSELEAWLDDAGQAPLPEGSRLTSGKTLTDPDSANDVGQIYHGRGVALLINSLTYSAADIFAAGFQDHAAGVMLGASEVTGGGGANVWSHQDLMAKVGPSPGIPLANLPGDASMSLAIRRSSRVGPFDGQPVEDQGVKVDVYYTADGVDDVIAGNPGLLRRACEELRHHDPFRIDADTPVPGTDGSVTVQVRTVNIALLKFFLNGHLALTDAPDSNAPKNFSTSKTFSVPPVAGISTPVILRIEGYTSDAVPNAARLVRARTISLKTSAVAANFDPATQSITGTDTA